ncbi:hypothetical protein GOP47_0023961 [Adiantum capillus-veneris]|uniref:Amino acid transporter transmembrane domain-containing protein n=1 Tax=Adiantum capillus-veneris TaxID=13818 RepID=A0A9D4U715_ADICA|nr:hypothetical protein GOP47_0023961 [Adiantum capillus-veneris]
MAARDQRQLCENSRQAGGMGDAEKEVRRGSHGDEGKKTSCPDVAAAKDGVSPTLGAQKEGAEGHTRETHEAGALQVEAPPGSGKEDLLNSNMRSPSDQLSSPGPPPISCVVDFSHMQLPVGAPPPPHNYIEDGYASYIASKLTVTTATKALSVELAGPPAPLPHPEKLKVLQLSPHDHNHGKSSFFQATLNCLSLLYGLGILSSPYAIAKTGWMGVTISIMISTSYAYTAYLMARCIEFDPACSNYQDIAKLALGKRMRKVITALFYMELTGTLVGYCISMGDNLNYFFPHVGFSLPGLSNRNIMICIVTLIILPSVWLRDLSALSFTSMWCIVSSVLLLVAVMVAATVNHIGFTHPLPFLRIKGVPVAAGLYAFSYGGTSVFPSIYKSMKDPSKFPQVLAVSFFIATTSIAGLGVAGAYMFGEHTASQVTLSMPVHFISTKIVLWMTILTPICKFALQLSPITTAVEVQLNKRCANMQKGGMNKTLIFAASTLMRSCVLALIAIISMILPYFEYIIALVGSSMTIAICMIFPCLFYLKLYWKRLPSFTIVFITVLILLGAIVGACGTIISFQGLVNSKTSHHHSS